MLEVDFHCHSLFSGCGLHTVVELLTEGKRRGLKALAITDHGPSVDGRMVGTFFERLGQPVEGIRLLKGIESNPSGLEGAIDLPPDLLKYMDIVLLGLHYNVRQGMGRKANTELLLRVLERNPCVDIVTHPGFDGYELDLPRVAGACAKSGVALELNNSKLLYAKQDPSEIEAVAEACARTGCPVAVCSDAHALQEVGEDSLVRAMLSRLGFPSELVVNRDAASALAFLERRRGSKKG
jgi:putative hydrolase